MVTTNKNKFLTMKRDFKKYSIDLEHISLSLPEIQSYNVDEIIGGKLSAAYKHVKKPCIVHDSGFFIPSLNGFPGALVHPILDKIDIDGILKLVDGKNRECYFYESIGYLDGIMKNPIFFSIKIKGSISEKPMGTKDKHHWSRLYEIFIPDKYNKTLAEMKKEKYIKWHDSYEINSYSARFAQWYKNRENL
ncbi:MAG: non-canonical purine NTP pyrophosphatase [Candidatus Micrarchaeaceae archaeon]